MPHQTLKGSPTSRSRSGLWPLLTLAAAVGVFCYVGGILWWMGWAVAAVVVVGIAHRSNRPAMFGWVAMALATLLVMHGVSKLPYPTALAVAGWLLTFLRRRRVPRLGNGLVRPQRRQHREMYLSPKPRSGSSSKRFRIG